MAIICLKVPSNIARTLEGLDVPGSHVPDKEKHVTTHTLGHLGVALPLDLIGKTISAVARATEKIKPFHVEAIGYGTPFGKNSMGIPVVCPIKSPELQSLHSSICSSLDEADIKHVRFPEFKPHVTLSWGRESIIDKAFKTPLAWKVDNIVLWCGAFGDERIYTVFELMG
jgi:2'-5' RNA ligase